MYHIEQISAIETYPVRQPVLREGSSIEACLFEGDTNENTYHLGLYFKSKLIGVASFIGNKSLLFSEEFQYQLRGMAILKDFQNKGLGNQLLIEGEKILIQNKVERLWFNAREIAVSFYKKNQYQTHGEAFNIPQIGLHYVMSKKLI